MIGDELKPLTIDDLRRQVSELQGLISSSTTNLAEVVRLRADLDGARRDRDDLIPLYDLWKAQWHELNEKNKELKAQHDRLVASYNELLYAVAQKHPNESRHDTALRYLREHERPSGQAQSSRPLRDDSDVPSV